MKAPRSAIRVYRILGWLAVIHALVLSLLVVLWREYPSDLGSVQTDLLADFATLWLLWLPVLTLHQGKSLGRAVTPLVVSFLLLLPAIQEYPYMAPHALGMPDGLGLSPRDFVAYLRARHAGRADAEKDLQAGILAVEFAGLPFRGDYGGILWRRYKIELRHIAGDTNITPQVIGHMRGYNDISESEIKRRFGEDTLEVAQQDALREWSN